MQRRLRCPVHSEADESSQKNRTLPQNKQLVQLVCRLVVQCNKQMGVDSRTMEPLYCGHLGDLVKCPVYSGTPLLWTPWGPGEVSCIQWNPSIVDTLRTW